jgi:hypothetical protein
MVGRSSTRNSDMHLVSLHCEYYFSQEVKNCEIFHLFEIRYVNSRGSNCQVNNNFRCAV